MRVSAVVNGTRLVWIDDWFDVDNGYRNVWCSGNWPIIPLKFVDDKSFERNDDVALPPDRRDKPLVLVKFVFVSNGEWPSKEPFVSNDDDVGRSFSEIVWESKGDCWVFGNESRDVLDDIWWGMFDDGWVDPGPE